MSIANLTAVSSIAQPRVSTSGTAAGGNEFGVTLDTAVGGTRKSQSGASSQSQQTDDISTSGGTASLADTTRALVGDVFGALGAQTPTMVQAQQAVAAYQTVS